MVNSDLDQISAERLRLALTHMGKHNIPVTPQNYAVWYDYVSSANDELNQALEGFIDKGGTFSDSVNEKFYRRYVYEYERKQADMALNELRKILAGISEQAKSTGGEMTQHGDSIKTFAQQLGQDSSVETIRSIVNDVISATRKISDSGQRLRDQLDSTSKEVDALRRQLAKVREQATTDPLTGLSNRMAFEEALERETGQAMETQAPLSILFADIDHFKRFNDTYGHLVGDMVLKMAANMIKGCINGEHVAARYGGEEFVVILPNTGLESAGDKAEKIRSFFEAKKWKQKDSGKSIGAVTLSLGVAVYRSGEPPENFLKRADKALYRSKETGRNKVTLETEL